jgi:hypothetical protein
MATSITERAARTRPRMGCWFLAIPVVSIALVFALYAYMLYHGFQGRMAEGESVELVFETCPEAQELILRRVDAMGLPLSGVRKDPNTLRIQVVLPQDPSVAATVPETLSSTALFEIWDREAAEDDEPLFSPDDFNYAGVRLTMTASPVTFVVLKPEAALALRKHMEARPHSGIRFTLDGEEVGSFNNMPSIGDGQVELSPREATNDKEVMEMAAARGIAINDGPLPCDAKVINKTPVNPGK